MVGAGCLSTDLVAGFAVQGMWSGDAQGALGGAEGWAHRQGGLSSRSTEELGRQQASFVIIAGEGVFTDQQRIRVAGREATL